MSQIFHPATNTLSRFSVVGTAGMLALAGWLSLAVSRSDYATDVHIVRSQPVEFSHEHHVGGLGIDCRYCHTAVEQSRAAGLPPTETCMQCHRQIWRDSPKLAAVRDSYRTGRPIGWTRVHDLPDFVYFDHSIHVAKGVACATCHGRVDRMPLVRREQTLHMQWCLECHRDPEERVGEPGTVFAASMLFAAPSGTAIARNRHLARVTHCSACHR